MDIEEDIKKLNKYIELVIDKNYCDCNELNTILGKHCDGSKNVAYSIKNILAEREEDKKRIEELEDENKVQRHQIMTVYDNGYVHKDKIKEDYIPKEKVKDIIEETKNRLKKHININKGEKLSFSIDGVTYLLNKLEEKILEGK